MKIKMIIKRFICAMFGHNYIEVGKWERVCLFCEDPKKIKGKRPTTAGIPKEMVDKYTWR